MEAPTPRAALTQPPRYTVVMGGRVEWVLTPLEQAGVRYLVVGGVAVVLHGHRVPLEQGQATVVAREDLIAMKRAAGRARDIEDVEALLCLSEDEP